MMLLSRQFCLFFSAIFLWTAASAPAANPASLDARREQLKKLVAEQWEYQLRESPELATTIGDYRYNDRWSDSSLAHAAQQNADTKKWLARFEAVDTTGFSEQEKLDQSLMVRNLKDNLTGFALKNHEMPIDQFFGVHLAFAQFVAIVPFDTTKQYEDYIARLNSLPHVIDDIIAVLQQGQKDGLEPPRFLLEKTVDQCKSIASPAGEANVFGQPATHFPGVVTAVDRARLHDAIIAAVDQRVRPAYMKLADYLAKDYAPKGRTGLGVWALPDGVARYRFAIHVNTTTDTDPESIHQLGLREVARIEGEQLTIAKKLGFSDLKSFRASLRTNPKVIPTSGEQILEAYRHYIAQMEQQLPKLFGLLPKTQVQVQPVQAFREKEAAAADYSQGTPDGSRPGIVYVNTSDYQHRTLISTESTAYHEGVPGHHMQISIAQTLPGLPPFRQQGGYTAYQEGWALYSERLGKDIGFYQDPYSDFGRLSDELLRADRLVLDTGVHFKHWTREQMIDFFHEHSSNDEPEIQSETDRYIAVPGQALAYKMGQLKILELRERAQKELGNKYDIKAFHDEILNGGALPLDVLDARVSAWIATQKATN